MSNPSRLIAAALPLLLAAACDRASTPLMTAPDPRIHAAPPSFAISGDSLMSTDFSEYTPGVQPEGWTQRWDSTAFFTVVADSGTTGGQVLQWSATGQSRNRWGLAWDGLGDRSDQEVLTDFRIRSLGGGTSVYYLGAAAVRMSGTAVNEGGYAVYFVTVPSTGAQSIVLSTWTGGAYVQLGSQDMAWTLDTWYSVRLQAVGTTIRARVWPRGETEPETWQLSATDSRYVSGRPGVSHHDNSTVQWDDWQVRMMSPPPPPPPPPPAATFTTQFAELDAWAPPSGWTETDGPDDSEWTVVADLSAQDGRTLRNVATATGRHVLRLDAAPGTVADQEILVKLRMADGDSRGPGVTLRHTMNGAAATAYVAYLRPDGDLLEINRFLNGSWGFVANAPFTNSPGTWYWLRFRVTGTQLQARAWVDGDLEPTEWTITASDGTVFVGSAGLYTYEPNTVDYDLVTYAPDGDTAPFPPAGTVPALDRVVASPASASGWTNHPVQLGAYGQLNNGDSVAITPTWSVLGGGSITAGGTFSSSSTGSFAAEAAFGGSADTVAIYISSPPASGGTSSLTTHFDDATPGTLPGTWTPTSAPTGVTWTVDSTSTPTDGVVMRAVVTSTGRHILQTEDMEAAQGQEALTLLRMGDDDNRGPGLALRHSMSGSTETAYVAYFRPGLDQV
ncbi:MAG TPA: hypothetical protein VM759_01190, partial [Longimicrobium sp.]|nr:hypothetical protein [Longimicrobium sp.]